MEFPILNDDKLQEIIKKVTNCGDSNIEILEKNICLGTEKGENFVGTLVRVDLIVNVGDEEKKFNWMVKIAPTDPAKIPINQSLRIDEKEVRFYADFLPKLKNFIELKNADIELDFCKAYHTEFKASETEYMFIIALENLKEQGLKEPFNKKKGLTIEYLKLALEALAKYHGTSYVYFKSMPGGLEQGINENKLITRDTMYSNPYPEAKVSLEPLEQSLSSMTDQYLQAMGQEDGIDYIGSLQKFATENGAEKFFQVKNTLAKPDPNFNVMIHGDPWFNNILFL